MALDKDILGDAMKAKVDALHIEQLPYAERQDSRAVYRAIAEAVVEHIKNFGQVNVSTTLSSPVTSCTGTAGSVTNPAATGTGTIT